MKAELIVTILSVLGFATLESANGQVTLSKEDVDKLKAYHKEKFGADLVIEGLNFDAENNATFHESEIMAIEAALAKEAPEKTNDGDPEDGHADEEKTQLRKQVKQLAAQVKKLEAIQRKAQETIIKLGELPEPDIPGSAPQGAGKQLMHSKTHLFASGRQYDAFEGRPWNRRAAGFTKMATDYTPIDITQINTDLGAYYRENQTEFISFLRAKNRLPAFWNTVSNIQDQIAYAKAFTGEVTQARKKKWLPKGNFEFQPELAKVYPIQIDVEFKGYELQSLETSWMSNLATIKQSGSTAYKMSFVAYLAQEILKKAAEEDQIGHIRGIYIPTDDEATTAGLAIHKQNGLLKLIKDAQTRRVYLPYSMGTPTEENICDYVENLVNRVPEYWRDMPGMVLYMATYWVDRYIKRRETLKGLMPTYAPDKLTVDRHENIRLVGLPFMNDSGFMFITTQDNISMLENIPEEKTLLEFEKKLRDIMAYADYKIGIHVWAFGYEYPEEATMTDEKQIFFSNDVDILPDLYILAAVNDTTPSVAYHTALQTGVNTQATAITDLDDAVVGQYIYIKGNSGTHPSTIANANKFDLADDITLDENTLICLYVRGVDDFVEIERWDLSLSTVVFLAPNATTADADLGNHFVTGNNSQATAITDISDAVDGDVYIIEGGTCAANNTTIAASGKFSRITAGITLLEGNWLKVKYNGEKFVELDRYVAA